MFSHLKKACNAILKLPQQLVIVLSLHFKMKKVIIKIIYIEALMLPSKFHMGSGSEMYNVDVSTILAMFKIVY